MYSSPVKAMVEPSRKIGSSPDLDQCQAAGVSTISRTVHSRPRIRRHSASYLKLASAEGEAVNSALYELAQRGRDEGSLTHWKIPLSAVSRWSWCAYFRVFFNRLIIAGFQCLHLCARHRPPVPTVSIGSTATPSALCNNRIAHFQLIVLRP